GDAWSTADVEAHIARSGYRSWLLQELVLPHPALSAISGTRHLQTIRVVTVLDQAGHAEAGAAWLRLIGGDAGFDNFNFGQSGNLLAPVGVATGRILRTLAADRGGFGLVEIASHPRTALPFASLSLPWWKEAHALALD